MLKQLKIYKGVNNLDIKKLEISINKRTALLSNENYINKAPSNIVNLDRTKLKEEKEKLESLKKLL